MKVHVEYTREQIVALMLDICRENGIELSFLTADGGSGGYNYGASAGDTIMLAPFVKAKAGEKIGIYEIPRACNNPLECMLISFFHEFAHCRLHQQVPNVLESYSSQQTSRYQYETWITMLGIKEAQERHGIVFSDETVSWMLTEGTTYIHKKDDENYGNSDVIALDIDPYGKSYTLQIDRFWIDKPEEGAKKKDGTQD